MTSMAGWPSLAGYLTHRPGGPLGRLQCRRRWFSLDENLGQLLGYKREADAGVEAPLLTIDVKGSALRLSLDDSRQMVILSQDREDVLVAESHESMLVWLLALQAKRDAFSHRLTSMESNCGVVLGRQAERRKESTTPSDSEMHTMIRQVIRAESRGPTSPINIPHSSSVLYNGHPLLGSTDLDSNSSGSLDGPSSCPLPSISDAGDPFECRSTLSEPLWPPPLLDDSAPGSRKSSGQSVASSTHCLPSGRPRDLENELISAKCHLAQVLNRETSLKSLLQEREQRISRLQRRLHQSLTTHPRGAVSPVHPRSHDSCRILRNQNRFLQEEVLKLARLWQQEQVLVRELSRGLAEQEARVEQLKREYVQLLQSCIRASSIEGPESPEVTLFGGSKPKQLVCQLVEEARKRNPSLPSYDGMTKAGCHVDPFGFRHVHINDGLTLHYLCRHLGAHYNAQLAAKDSLQVRWQQFLEDCDNGPLPRTKELKTLVRAGVPNHLRGRVWVALVKERVHDIVEAKGHHYYSHVASIAPEAQSVSQYRRQIALDLLRTMPNNVHFSEPTADGVKKMQEVLQAFCLHSPNIGYCQGMNFIVGMSLLFMEPEDAFWCLVAVTERYFLPHYFDQSLVGAQADQEVLRELVRDHLPALSVHLTDHDIELCTVTLNWFLAIFFDCVPFETLLRIWDCFLLEGPKVLFRFSLAILKMSESAILEKQDAVAIMRQIKAAAKLMFDVDGLIQMAFEGLEPFPRRPDINSKQTCYYKALKELSKKRAVERRAVDSKEWLLQELSVVSDKVAIECAAVFDKDKLWVCQGFQHLGQVFKVNGSENIMYKLNIEFDSRVMSIHTVNECLLLLGTLSRTLHAFNPHSREEVWRMELNDAILAICSYETKEKTTAYAALADGTIAILEKIARCGQVAPHCLYVQIAFSPISCLHLVDHQLWCASGNRITILDARSMDVADQFVISSNSMDIISHLAQDDFGVWISVRGSSILQVWDHRSLVCKMMFDVRDNKYSHGMRDDDSGFNPSRITALLPFANSLWVGTGDGNLLVFDVSCRCVSKTSVVDSQNVDRDNCGFPVHESTSPNTNIPISETAEKPKHWRDRSDSGYQTVGVDTLPSRSMGCLRWDEGELCQDNCSTPTVRGSSSAEFSPRQSCDGRCEGSITQKDAETRSYNTDLLNVEPSQCTGDLNSTDCNSDLFLCRESDDILHAPSGKRQYADRLDRFFGSYLRRLMPRRRHSVALSEMGFLRPLREVSPCVSEASDPGRRCPPFGSFDDVSHLLTTGSRESVLSSNHCDSYEYDDVFVTYTEDDRGPTNLKPSDTSQKALVCAEELIQMLQPKSDSTSQLQCHTCIPLSVDCVDSPSAPHVTLPLWSSLDDISSPSHVEYDSVQDSQTRMDLLTLSVSAASRTAKSSDSGSFVSYSSNDVPFTLELTVKQRIKIADQPIRVLLAIRCGAEDAIISCSGSCADDEAILKWTLEGEEQLWINDPIVEVCPYTNMVKPSPYTRSRLPRRSSSIVSPPPTTFSIVSPDRQKDIISSKLKQKPFDAH